MKYSRLILANLFRKKMRLILTVGSFAVALFLFTFLAVVRSAFSRGTELAACGHRVPAVHPDRDHLRAPGAQLVEKLRKRIPVLGRAVQLHGLKRICAA